MRINGIAIDDSFAVCPPSIATNMSQQSRHTEPWEAPR